MRTSYDVVQYETDELDWAQMAAELGVGRVEIAPMELLAEAGIDQEFIRYVLRAASGMKAAWCKETTFPGLQDVWSKDNPSIGHCGNTSQVMGEEAQGRFPYMSHGFSFPYGDLKYKQEPWLPGSRLNGHLWIQYLEHLDGSVVYMDITGKQNFGPEFPSVIIGSADYLESKGIRYHPKYHFSIGELRDHNARDADSRRNTFPDRTELLRSRYYAARLGIGAALLPRSIDLAAGMDW